MIDEKKIAKAAFDLYQNSRLDFVSSETVEGFKQGAKWAINEFLKDLWHPMQEEPKLVGEEIIIEMFLKGKRHTIVLKYMVGEEVPIASLESVRWITDWNSFSQSRDNVIKYRWCYFKDLFPKEGGKNEKE